jgi:hypothetical protein
MWTLTNAQENLEFCKNYLINKFRKKKKKKESSDENTSRSANHTPSSLKLNEPILVKELDDESNDIGSYDKKV